jgi:SAM-dependent methyltransferase
LDDWVIPDGTEIYWDGRHYDLDNAQMREDISYYRELATCANGSVLELACGTGRLTLPCALAGATITGLDISEPMLAEARRKAAEKGAQVELLRADCVSYRTDRRFDLIFMGFNSLQHIHVIEEVLKLLSSVAQHLSTHGVFAFDVLHPDLDDLTRDPSAVAVIGAYNDPDTGEPLVVRQHSTYDRSRQVQEHCWDYTNSGGETLFSKRHRLRCFFPRELDLFLASSGLRILDKLGSFDGRPFTSESPKQIVLAGL